MSFPLLPLPSSFSCSAYHQTIYGLVSQGQRGKKKNLYKSDIHFSNGNHPFEVGDVNFQMLKWLPNILLTLHKVYELFTTPVLLPCMCMNNIFTYSEHAVF